MVQPVYTLERGHVIARDGLPLLTLARARTDSGHYEIVAAEADLGSGELQARAVAQICGRLRALSAGARAGAADGDR